MTDSTAPSSDQTVRLRASNGAIHDLLQALRELAPLVDEASTARFEAPPSLTSSLTFEGVKDPTAAIALDARRTNLSAAFVSAEGQLVYATHALSKAAAVLATRLDAWNA